MKRGTAANNGSFPMRVSVVCQVHCPQASFVSVDTDVATQCLTGHSRGAWNVGCKVEKLHHVTYIYVANIRDK